MIKFIKEMNKFSDMRDRVRELAFSNELDTIFKETNDLIKY